MDKSFSAEISMALQRAEPEIQNLVREFETQNAKLDKRLAKLEVQNLSYKNRIAALEQENADYSERFRKVETASESGNALFERISKLQDELVKIANIPKHNA